MRDHEAWKENERKRIEKEQVLISEKEDSRKEVRHFPAVLNCFFVNVCIVR